MKYVFNGQNGTYADAITVIIEAELQKDAWDILEGMSRIPFQYWNLEIQA